MVNGDAEVEKKTTKAAMVEKDHPGQQVVMALWWVPVDEGAVVEKRPPTRLDTSLGCVDTVWW